MRNPGRTAGLGRSLHRQTVRLSRAAYLGIERSPLAPFLRIPVVQRLKTRVTYMPGSQVLALLDLVEAAGVQAWVAGGWGVDALAGRQTRRHYDLDLLIGDDHGDLAQVAHALTQAGFQLAESEQNPGLAMPSRHFWRHDSGYSVEVLPVALREPPFSWAGPATAGTATAGTATADTATADTNAENPSAENAAEAPHSPFAQGSIDGRPVPCLSAAMQLTLHSGYPPRDIDVTDTAMLRACLSSVAGHD
jgi:lincosamide nucleotidyltransferase A/C/D/E